ALGNDGAGNSGGNGNTNVLGAGWIPTAPVEAAGGAEWRNVRLEVATEEVVTETENEEGEIELETTVVPVGEYAVLTDLEGYEYAFEVQGGTFASPPELSGWVLARQDGSHLTLTDEDGNRTTFENTSGGSEYLPVSVSQPGGTANKTSMVYQLVGGKKRLSMLIAPSAGIECTEANATTTLGCRALTFSYLPATTWGAPGSYGDRLSTITYYGGPPWAGGGEGGAGGCK